MYHPHFSHSQMQINGKPSLVLKSPYFVLQPEPLCMFAPRYRGVYFVAIIMCRCLSWWFRDEGIDCYEGCSDLLNTSTAISLKLHIYKCSSFFFPQMLYLNVVVFLYFTALTLVHPMRRLFPIYRSLTHFRVSFPFPIYLNWKRDTFMMKIPDGITTVKPAVDSQTSACPQSSQLISNNLQDLTDPSSNETRVTGSKRLACYFPSQVSTSPHTLKINNPVR